MTPPVWTERKTSTGARMTIRLDIFTGNDLCSHPDCQWKTPDGWSGIEARYRDAEGNPSCYSHRSQNEDEEE